MDKPPTLEEKLFALEITPEARERIAQIDKSVDRRLKQDRHARIA